MRKFKLSSAGLVFGIILAGAAHAADLPSSRKGTPVEFVRICNAYGAGYFFIPGTDTCLKIGGQVRGEITVRGNTPTRQNQGAGPFTTNLAGQVFTRDLTSFRARAYLKLEARTATEYGALRTVINARFANDTSVTGPVGGAKNALGQSAAFNQGAGTNSQTFLQAAYIQFAGLTAGRAQSFFDFYTHDYELLTATNSGDEITNLLAYTQKFGGGFSATLAIEDPTARIIADTQGLNPTKTKAVVSTYAGQRQPDVIGNLRLDQDWGSAQISGAYHNVTSSGPLVAGTLPIGTPVGSKAGYALEGGLKINLPMIAKGDSLTLQAGYARGSLDYLTGANFFGGTNNVYTKGYAVALNLNDAFLLPNASLGLSKGYNVFAGFQHYWMPTLRSSLFGSYLSITDPAVLKAGVNARFYDIGANLLWSPVSGFDIGPEVVYTRIQLKSSIAANLPAAPAPAKGSDLRARFSLRRSF